MVHKKRPMYIENLVERANFEMRHRKLKYDESNGLFWMMNNLLLSKDMYQGFNFYYDLEIEINGERKVISSLSGDSINYEYIQLY